MLQQQSASGIVLGGVDEKVYRNGERQGVILYRQLFTKRPVTQEDLYELLVGVCDVQHPAAHNIGRIVGFISAMQRRTAQKMMSIEEVGYIPDLKEITGYGAIQAVIFSTVDEILTPPSSRLYAYNDKALSRLRYYTAMLCLGCAAEGFGFASRGQLDSLLRTRENPVAIAGKRVTPICEGMWMHQQLLDTYTCDSCQHPLRERCTDY
ncbi:MAG: hypothetical protein WCD86_16210 [Ktedonobacteraceae bacterium]